MEAAAVGTGAGWAVEAGGGGDVGGGAGVAFTLRDTVGDATREAVAEEGGLTFGWASTVLEDDILALAVAAMDAIIDGFVFFGGTTAGGGGATASGVGGVKEDGELARTPGEVTFFFFEMSFIMDPLAPMNTYTPMQQIKTANAAQLLASP